MEPLGLKIRKALSRLNQTDNYLFRKPEREWNSNDLSLVKSFLRTARVEEDNTMKELQKVKEFFSKPLEEVSAEYSRKNKRPIKVGDIVGNTVQGFDFKVLGIQDDKMKVMNIVTGKEFTTDIDNMRLSSTDNPVKEGGKRGYLEATKNMNKFIQNQLDDMGVEYEMDPKNLSRPFTAIYKPENKSEEFNAKFEDFINKANLKDFVKISMKEGELNEAYVPSNIAEFAKRKGVSSLVKTVAGWAEKVGKKIVGGTAIGKNYDTLILDMTYQGSEIRINTEYETIELYDEPVRTFAQFKSVYEENQEENLDEATNDSRIDNPKFGPAPKQFADLRAKLGDKSFLDKIQMINVNVLRDLLDELDSYNLEEDKDSTYNEYSEVGYKKVGEGRLTKAYASSTNEALSDPDITPSGLQMHLINLNKELSYYLGKGGKANLRYAEMLKQDIADARAELDRRIEAMTADEIEKDENQFRREQGLEEGMGGQLDEKYFIEVSVRDARKAIDIFNDQYSKADIEMYGSNVYASNTISDIYDLYYDLTSQGIEILDYDIDESDFDDESDDLEEVTNEFSPISYAMKVIKGEKLEDVMKESGLRFVELKSLIDKIQKGLIPSMNEEQYGRSKLQKGFEDAISKETFSKLKGKKVGYFGNTYKVIDSDEYIITLQDDDGDIKTVNLNQFIQKGIIPELKKRIQETIKLGEGMIEEELCAKGKAYRKRRLAAGEKSSAYLSGRAVKVCKGQMSGRKKK